MAVMTVELKRPGWKAEQVKVVTLREAVRVVRRYLRRWKEQIGWEEWTLFVLGGGGGKVRINGRVRFYVNFNGQVDRWHWKWEYRAGEQCYNTPAFLSKTAEDLRSKDRR